MPFRSKAQERFLFARHPSIAKEFANATPKGARLPERIKKKKKPSIIVKNHLKEFGNYNERTRRIEINVKKHKGDRAQLADTIDHELNHVKHPRASERWIRKKTHRDDMKMSYEDKNRLLAKIRMKKLNYRVGVIKRKYKMDPANVEPGAMIRKANESKLSRRDIAIRGLV